MLDDTTIGKLYRSKFGWNVLVDLTQIDHRLAGSQGESQAAQRVKEAFHTAGLDDVRIHEFPIQGWERGDAQLAVEAPLRKQFPVIGLPRSPPGQITAEIVDVGYGRPEDYNKNLAGKIVLASSIVPDDYPRRIHRQDKYEMAINKGAVGFIFWNHIPGQLFVTGSVGMFGGLGKIPAIGVSYETGCQLSRLCARGRINGTLLVQAKTGPAISTIVEGVTGPDSEREVLVTAHHDAHDISQGAIDDGAGTAITCELARVLSHIPLETRLRFITFGSEEVGLEGSKWWSDTYGVKHVKAVVNNDFFDGDLIMLTHGFPGLQAVVEEVNVEYGRTIKTTSTRHGMWTIADSWNFVKHGAPSLFARADRGRWRGWGHTNADTLDKVKISELRDHALLIAAVVEKLTEKARALPRRTPEEIMIELKTHGIQPIWRTHNS